jgi:hypothetical protein
MSVRFAFPRALRWAFFLWWPLGLRRVVDHFEQIAGGHFESAAEFLEVHEGRVVGQAAANLAQR